MWITLLIFFMHHVLDRINYTNIIEKDDRYKTKDNSCIVKQLCLF